MAAWYQILIKQTRGHIRDAGFKLIICLLPERSTSTILVQSLVNRWWDTTHTFHIANREMTVTPHDWPQVRRGTYKLRRSIGYSAGHELARKEVHHLDNPLS